MKNTPQVQTDTYYHIYNRGINGETLFKKQENFQYFLKKYDQYISPIANTLVYCLLDNHFHFLIHTHSEKQILAVCKEKPSMTGKSPSQIISLHFSHLFNSYTQAINKQSNRTGKLFELPFRRVAVADDHYLTRLIYYIHANPQRHGLVKDFRKYRYSSYLSHLSTRHTHLDRKSVQEWFGGLEEFERFHNMNRNEDIIQSREFDDF